MAMLGRREFSLMATAFGVSQCTRLADIPSSSVSVNLPSPNNGSPNNGSQSAQSPLSDEVFTDGFDGTTLKPGYQWINESPSDWKLLDGRLDLRRYQGHGFYRTPTTYHGQTPVPVLYREGYQLSDGFQVQCKVGFYNEVAFGQAGILLFNDLDNYCKLVIEFNIMQEITIVLLKETNGVDSRAPEDLIGTRWDRKTQVEFRLTYNNGRLLSEIRENDQKPWMRHFETSSNLPEGLIKVGLFAESDQPSAGSTEHAWFDDFVIRAKRS
jgi:regulation of enolase protein 1 (concanavalin A-like superfamily)